MDTKEQKKTDIVKAGHWTEEQVALIQNTVAKGTTKDEFALFLYTANKYGLDPLIKQIWCIKYGSEPAAIFTGRDGFLSKAHESGQFNGMKTTVRIEPVPFAKKIKKKGYNGKSDEWIDFKKETQFVATTLVYRKDMEHPIEVEVWEEEYSSGQSNWVKMPRTMISKVSESQATRKAFNISGLYSEEEQGAFQENAPTVDVEGIEMLSDEIQNQINQASTREEVKVIWDNNKSLHRKSFFYSAIQKRGEEIMAIPTEPQSPGEEFHQVAAPLLLEVPDAVIQDILIIENIKDLNAFVDSNPKFKGNKRFSDAVNKQKLAIGKKLQRGVVA